MKQDAGLPTDENFYDMWEMPATTFSKVPSLFVMSLWDSQPAPEFCNSLP